MGYLFEEVKCLVEQGGDDITQPVLSEALKEANNTEAEKKDIRSKLIEIRKFLKERLDNIAGCCIII
ncbi:hypothetical protein [Wolbachia pipientis]|uniref:hypothetical protein n=1 Tax=Wolbachia pipientis TaxID=955 RepID=UPI0025A481EB|nr:hypothetical protein [Wolbachia pipientis]MDM8335433.1 hypothetical protein [Wolbachia pipientis]